MAVKEGGARSVMNSYQEVDGEAPAGSRRLLTEVLRDQWGFDGFVVADYGAVTFLHAFHHVTAGRTESAAAALAAGLDVELPNPGEFPQGIPDALERGLLTMADVDRAVERVLRHKVELGLFEAPYADPDGIDLDRPEDRALAAEVARRSITLLRNDGLLPIDPAAGQRVAVIGPNADDRRALFGNYSFENHILFTHFPHLADRVQVPTVLDALRERLDGERVVHDQGCEVMGDDASGIADAVAAAAAAELAVVVVGDKAGHFRMGTVGEGTDTADLSLPGVQARLVDEVLATGTPTVVVLLNGRPFALGDLAERAAAIVEAWFPGQDGAAAVADVLVGAAEPCGRTTLTFSRGAGVQPWTYDHKWLAPGFPRLPDVDPVFPFGHGLSYTTFTYDELEIAPPEVPVDGTFSVSCTVTNAGSRPGDEVVQLYLGDPVASVTRPVRELKGFARVPLAPGAAARITFEVPVEVMAFTGVDLRRIVEPGALTVEVGASSVDVRLQGSVEVVGDVRSVGEDRALTSGVVVAPI